MRRTTVSMSDEKQQQDPIAEKEEDRKEGKDDASKQEDIQVKISTTTNIDTSQENAMSQSSLRILL
jgi:hypothetical protein